MKTFLIFTSSLLFLLTGCSSSEKNLPNDPQAPPRRLEYSYAQLQLRDLEQIKKIINGRVIKADAGFEYGSTENAEAVHHLQDAVRILFSRPDQDGGRTPLFSELRKRLADLMALDQVLQSLADESIAGIRSEHASPVEKATYVYLLENMMSEIKAEREENAFFKSLITRIRDAKLVIDRDVAQSNIVRSMNPLVSPSKTADAILKNPGKKARRR